MGHIRIYKSTTFETGKPRRSTLSVNYEPDKRRKDDKLLIKNERLMVDLIDKGLPIIYDLWDNIDEKTKMKMIQKYPCLEEFKVELPVAKELMDV